MCVGMERVWAPIVWLCRPQLRWVSALTESTQQACGDGEGVVLGKRLLACCSVELLREAWPLQCGDSWALRLSCVRALVCFGCCGGRLHPHLGEATCGQGVLHAACCLRVVLAPGPF